MNPSVENPIYSVVVTTKNKIYTVTDALVSLETSEQEKQIAVGASIGLYDVSVDEKKLSDLISLRDLVVISANDGKINDEVFRGYVWDISPKETLTDSDFTIKCYDQLIYWQESEDSEFYAAGKDTFSIISSIFKKWGISGIYEYSNIGHEKLVLRGTIADYVASDILDPVQKKTGKKYVIRCEKQNVAIRTVGTNKTVYTISKGANAIEVRRYISMNGLTTQVLILGKSSDNGKTPVEATIKGDTGKYGTLQKVINKSEDTTLADAKKEANNIIEESGTPKWEYDITAPDIPWIRKGDKVNVSTNSVSGSFIVKSISRDISNRGKTMALTVTK